MRLLVFTCGYVPRMRAGLPLFIRERFDPAHRYGLRLTLVGLAIVLVAVPFSTLLFQVLGKGPLTRIDGDIANRLNGFVYDSPNTVTALKLISYLGTPVWFYVLIGLAMLWVWRRNQKRLVLFLFVTSLGGGLVDTAVKILVNRPRPKVDHPIHEAFGKSFPSGHSMSSVICYGALFLVLVPIFRSRAARHAALAATIAICLAIGSSRLMLGVHFFSDVLGGYVLGLAWLIGSVAVFEVWRMEEGKPKTAPLEEGVEPEAAPDLREGLPAS